jgi:putative membrane protein
VTLATTPWSFHDHVATWAVLACATAAGIVVHLARTGHPERPPIGRVRAVLLSAGLASLLIATSWPVADLAHRYLLLAHIGQDLLICLAAPGLLLAGLPPWLAGKLTEQSALHGALRRLAAPPMAWLVFNVAVIGAQLPPVVAETSRSWAVNGLVDAALFFAGVVLWVPVVRSLPGLRFLSTPGRAAYLFVQSLLPNFVSLAYIFAHRPFYPVYSHGARQVGITPLLDQQVSGVLAKVVGVFVLWGTAVVVLLNASRAEEAGLDPDPLTWDDVDRELRRLERRRRHVDQDH